MDIELFSLPVLKSMPLSLHQVKRAKVSLEKKNEEIGREKGKKQDQVVQRRQRSVGREGKWLLHMGPGGGQRQSYDQVRRIRKVVSSRCMEQHTPTCSETLRTVSM